MTTSNTLYIHSDSWLHRFDPRVKLWFMLLGIVLCVLFDDITLLISILLLTQLVLLTAVGLPPVRVAWKSLLPLLLVILLLQPLLIREGDLLWQIGPIRLTNVGLLTGLSYALRLASAAFITLVPLLSTPLHLLVQALQKWGLPYRWGMLIGLALHYPATLGNLYSTIVEAQQARGLDLSNKGIYKRVQAAIPTVIAVIIASLRLSESLSIGLAARGYGLDRKRTHLVDIKMRPLDWWGIVMLSIGFVTVLYSML